MKREDWIYVIAAAAATISIGLWAWLILLPAVSSYRRVHERAAAAVMSVFVLGAMVLAGGLLGALFLYNFDRL